MPGNHRSILHLCIFVISSVLYGWNHTVCLSFASLSGTFAKAKEAAGSSEGGGREARELRQQDLICCRKLPPRHQGRGLRGRGGKGRVRRQQPDPGPLPQAWNDGGSGGVGRWCCQPAPPEFIACMALPLRLGLAAQSGGAGSVSAPRRGGQACACPCQRPIPPSPAVLCSAGSPTSFLAPLPPDAVSRGLHCSAQELDPSPALGV